MSVMRLRKMVMFSTTGSKVKWGAAGLVVEVEEVGVRSGVAAVSVTSLDIINETAPSDTIVLFSDPEELLLLL